MQARGIRIFAHGYELKLTEISISGSVFSRFLSTSSKRTIYKVAVEGNIGSGKTTLINYFANDPNVDTFAEPVKKWRDVRGHNALVSFLSYRRSVIFCETLASCNVPDVFIFWEYKFLKCLKFLDSACLCVQVA